MPDTNLTASPDPLPSPAERPGSDVVIYDGACGLCTAQVRKLPWWDGRQRLSYLSLHDAEVARHWPDLSPTRLQHEMCVMDARGRQHWGPVAVRYLTRRLPRLWWLAPLLHIPGSMLLWRPLYRWLARNRYRLSGKPSCEGDVCKY